MNKDIIIIGGESMPTNEKNMPTDGKSMPTNEKSMPTNEKNMHSDGKSMLTDGKGTHSDGESMPIDRKSTHTNVRSMLEAVLCRTVSEIAHDRLFVLVDTTTLRLCWPVVESFPCMKEATLITIGATDENKTLETLSFVWSSLQRGGATRHSLMLNLGGGMVTDLGGFAASTFKRGLAYVNIPTTLLSLVDASVGGKTGINFGGLKNEIGVFSIPRRVLLCTEFLRTLDYRGMCSGYAEMLKHGLISDEAHFADLLRFDLDDVDYSRLQDLVSASVAVKKRIVDADPTEKGLRKALNLGHTAGHAFESLALQRGEPVLHGYAVAWGLVCELYLSVRRLGFAKNKLQQVVQFVREHYGTYVYDCHQYDQLHEFMTHDKKNVGDVVNFTLLADIGDVRIDQSATRDEVFDMLDFYRECMGC